MNVQQSGLVCELNYDEKTAKVIGFDSQVTNAIIPKSINYENQDFIITSLKGKLSLIQSIQFASDSKVRLIDEETFKRSNITSISLPSSLTTIGKCAFIFCRRLRNVEIPTNSELKEIYEYAFSNTNITKFSIPSGIQKLYEGWRIHTKKLKEIKIIQQEIKNIKYYDDKELVIIGKTDINSDVYDALIHVDCGLRHFKIPSFITIISTCAFTYSSIESILIPSHVKKICYSAFCVCNNLKVVEFQQNSELEIIEKYAFSQTSIRRFHLPKNVTEINDYAFSFCDNLKIFEFPNDSKLIKIGSNAFNKTSMKSLFIPSRVKEIDEESFNYMYDLLIIEFDDNSEFRSFNKSLSHIRSTVIIMIPSCLKDYI